MSKEKSRKYFIPMLKWLWNIIIKIISRVETWKTIQSSFLPEIIEATLIFVLFFIGLPIIYVISKIMLTLKA